jgi:hypothetical protein
MKAEFHSYDLSNASRIGEGCEGTIYALANGLEVMKVYHDGIEDRKNTARKEYQRLVNATNAFRILDRIQSPTPIELYLDPPAIRMGRCFGTPLLRYLIEHRHVYTEQSDLVRLLSDGIISYVNGCDEGLPDCSIRNLLYDPQNGVLSFLDFSPSSRQPGVDHVNHAIIFSIGSLISSTLYECLLPSSFAVVSSWPRIIFIILAASDRVLTVDSGRTQSVVLGSFSKLIHKYCTTQSGIRNRIAYQMLALPLAAILRYLLRKAENYDTRNELFIDRARVLPSGAKSE